MNDKPAVFASEDDFDRHDAARAAVERLLRSPGGFQSTFGVPGAPSTKTWVEITGHRIEGDYRVLYPAKFVTFDENETSYSVAPKWTDSDETETLDRICVCVVPNGAVLKKYSRHEANVYGNVVVLDSTSLTFTGVLSTRLNDVSGEIELDAAPSDVLPLKTMDATIKITWEGGYQEGHTVTGVIDGTSIISFAGGGLTPEETVLPAEGTTVTVTVVRTVEVAVVMVDVMDASAVVRITDDEAVDGRQAAYVQESDGLNSDTLVDGELVWVKSLGGSSLEEGTYPGEFITRLATGGRAVYGVKATTDGVENCRAKLAGL